MKSRSDIETLLEEILVDAYGEDEQLGAFRQVIEDEVPLPTEGAVIGETVQVTKIDYAGHPYLSADITGSRFDVAALGLTPLKLSQFGMWDPAEHYWGEEDDPEQEWEREIKARGPRPEYELENVIPGEDREDFDSDPILEAVELKDAGDPGAADQLLNGLLIADLRCLDAHAHLGNQEFARRPDMAIRHYEIGVQIGNLSLGPDFSAVLPWGLINNRPYLRCLHGYGLCLWRLKRFDEAAAVFSRMLWKNPSDNQGARFNLHSVRAGNEWKDHEEE
jgi:tetratricopeptide (TPR) repeat protein